MKEDKRDYVLGAAPLDMPDVFMQDIAWKLPIFYQKQQPACGAHAGAWLKMLLDEYESPGRYYTPRFNWIDIKTFDGFALTDGTDMRSVFRSLQNSGALNFDQLENDVDLSLEKYADRKAVTLEMRTESLPHTARPYAFVSDLSFAGLKRAIFQYKGVILLIKVGSEFWTDKNGVSSWQEKDILPLRPPQSIVSGHFVCAHSFDQDTIYFANSFSEQWGKKGHGYFKANYMPYVLGAGATVDVPDNGDVKYVFVQQCDFGSTGNEVQELQKLLKKEGFFPANQPTTQYFGSITQTSLKKYQAARGIASSGTPATTGWGRVGPKTILALNAE